MKVSITHDEPLIDHVKVYYVHCTIELSQEEHAIIRERTLGENTLGFETGFVNRPRITYKKHSYAALKYTCFLMVVAAFVLMGIGLGFIGFLLILFSIALFIYARVFLYLSENRADTHDIRLRDIATGSPFSVSNLGTPLVVEEIEFEMQEQLELLKRVLVRTSVYAQPKRFEL